MLSCVRVFATAQTVGRQLSLSFTISQSLLKLKSIELMIHLTISSSFAPFSSCSESFPASGSFPVSQLFTSGGHNIVASPSALEKESETIALFTVTDTGCGILREKQDQIFNRFEKLNEGAQGTGLGLSICQLIIEQIGGRIWIDPDYTEGARFRFTHPVWPAKEKEAER